VSVDELHLTGGYCPRPRSRVQGPRRVLQELRRLRMKTARALAYRRLTVEEELWSARVYDALDRVIQEGDQVLPGHDAPDRKVRKRPLRNAQV